jgi:predicted transcriptional regulator
MELTKAEEQIMQILWKKEKAFVKEIVAEFEEPRPAYNTISTIVRILVKKKIVAYNSYGKTHQYYPLILKNDYKRKSLKKIIDGYFNQSYKNLVSFFSKEEDLSIEEMEEIKQLMEDKIKQAKKDKK